MANTNTSASTSTRNNSTNQVQGTTEIQDPAVKLAASRGMLTADTRYKLEGIVKQLDEKTTNSKFLKIADGETVCLLFDPGKVEHVVITYPKKEGDKEEPKPVNRIKFRVKQGNINTGLVPDDSEEIEWTTSETTGKAILKWVLKGFFLLDVERHGSGKFDTKYDITPHM